MIEQIKKKINLYKKCEINRFFNNVIEIDFNEFSKKLLDFEFVLECVDKLFDGDIFILRNTLKKDFIESSIDKMQKFYLENSPISPKILEGCKNGYYMSNNTSSGYKTVDRSFYFFSWNKDELNIYKEILKIYYKLKILNGLKAEEITNNTPQNEVVERLHVIHYPIGGGEISKHIDPINKSIINHGIFGSEYGKDYDRGGFYLINKKKEKKLIDKMVGKGDSVIFFPGLIHGVDPVFLKDEKLDIKSKKGRWYFNFQLIETHELKNRQTTFAIE